MGRKTSQWVPSVASDDLDLVSGVCCQTCVCSGPYKETRSRTECPEVEVGKDSFLSPFFLESMWGSQITNDSCVTLDLFSL